MKVTYDHVADAMYIYFSDKKKVSRTEEVRDDLILDYAGRELVGIEILDASEKFHPKDLKSISSLPLSHIANISS